MRNYIGELRKIGISYKALSRDTGLPISRLKTIKSGKLKISSSSKFYNVIRNVNRRESRRYLIKSGLTTTEADNYRRIGLSEQSYFHESIRQVKHTEIMKTMYQLRMLAKFENNKTRERRIINCYSLAHANIDLDSVKFLARNLDEYFNNIDELTEDEFDDATMLINEAVREGQSRLGGSNWTLISIIDIEQITYKIG